jgi:hypothetical protein
MARHDLSTRSHASRRNLAKSSAFQVLARVARRRLWRAIASWRAGQKAGAAGQWRQGIIHGVLKANQICDLRLSFLRQSHGSGIEWQTWQGMTRGRLVASPVASAARVARSSAAASARLIRGESAALAGTGCAQREGNWHVVSLNGCEAFIGRHVSVPLLNAE